MGDTVAVRRAYRIHKLNAGAEHIICRKTVTRKFVGSVRPSMYS